MAQLEFEYSQNKIIIQVNLTDLFSIACNKYYQKSDIKPNSVFFMKKTMVIPGNKKIIDLMDETEKESKKMHISVFPLYIDENDKVIIVFSLVFSIGIFIKLLSSSLFEK